MAPRKAIERLGKVLATAVPLNDDVHVGLALDPHKNLKIVHSMCVSGDFPNEDATVTFDFVGEKDDMLVHLVGTGFGKQICALWSVKAVEDRDAKGLVGFKQFAEALGLSGANLAHLILGFRPL